MAGSEDDGRVAMEIVTPQERQMYDASQSGSSGSGDNDDDKGDDSDDDKPETPEQVFEDRYPQPVHVSDIVGKPMIQTDNTPIGMVRHVVRGADGKMRLVVPYGGFLGFGARLVAVPLELVASIGTAIVSLDMHADDYAKAPTWRSGDGTKLPLDTPMRVAITRH